MLLGAPSPPQFYAETGLRRALGRLLGSGFSLTPHVLLQGQSWAFTTSNKKSPKGRDTGT